MIEVRRGEAVGRRLKLGMRTRRRKVQGIEVADEVAIHAVGADQHQGADGFACGPEGLLAAYLNAFLLGLRAYFPANLAFLASPVRAESVEQIAVSRNALILVLPGGAVRFGEDRILALLQIREKGAPVRCDRSRIFLKALVQVFDVGGVRALKKRG